MNRGVYTLATGMVAAQQAMDMVANNLANANTNGFKQDGLTFTDALTRQLSTNGGSGADIGALGSGSQAKLEFTDFTEGSLTHTNNPLDLALEGNGMYAVQTGAGIRYTRDGALTKNSDGKLVTKEGWPVLDRDLKEITLPEGEIRVATDGTISMDNSTDKIAQIGVFTGSFTKQGLNLYSSPDAAPTNGVGDSARVHQGVIEGSNVNPVVAMVQMIQVSRAFEMAQKAIQGQDDSTGKLLDSMRQN